MQKFTPAGHKHSITIEDNKITGFDETLNAEQQIDAQGKTVVAGSRFTYALAKHRRMLSILRLQEAKALRILCVWAGSIF